MVDEQKWLDAEILDSWSGKATRVRVEVKRVVADGEARLYPIPLFCWIEAELRDPS
jgi:hypothetical protein